MQKANKRLAAEEYAQGVLAGGRVLLSKSITLIESSLESDKAIARRLMEGIMPHSGKSIRIGITGVPGVGKSTFIETLGLYLCGLGKKTAVLAIDPSSQRSKGSILGDKTRMELLSNHPLAYIRPSPAGGALGGVAGKTREAMFLCEAAGFEVIIVETVGVGQSETAVKGMVDYFLLLMLSGAGDELQGIKKGIMEMADGMAITKADGANIDKAKAARAVYQNALHLFPPSENGWYPQVLACSALETQTVAKVWEQAEKFIAHVSANGWLEINRRGQNLHWLHDALRAELVAHFYQNENIQKMMPDIEDKVVRGVLPAIGAAAELLASYEGRR